MFYAMLWFLVLALLALWSACVWVLHGLAVWSLTGVGAMVGQSPQLERLPVPQWIAIWLPPDLVPAVQASAAAVLPWLEAALSALPSLAGWLAPLAWVVWGLGFLVLALCGLALHAVIAMARRPAVQAAVKSGVPPMLKRIS